MQLESPFEEHIMGRGTPVSIQHSRVVLPSSPKQPSPVDTRFKWGFPTPWNKSHSEMSTISERTVIGGPNSTDDIDEFLGHDEPRDIQNW